MCIRDRYYYNGAAKQENTQTTFKASGSADIGSHEVSFGFEFEQRQDYYWGSSPRSLWTLGRQLANNHILERDLSNPLPGFNQNGIFNDTINYNRLYNSEIHSTFDKSLRDALNISINGLEYIDIDSYDPSTFDISMFSQDELLNNGSNPVSYTHLTLPTTSPV